MVRTKTTKVDRPARRFWYHFASSRRSRKRYSSPAIAKLLTPEPSFLRDSCLDDRMFLAVRAPAILHWTRVPRRSSIVCHLRLALPIEHKVFAPGCVHAFLFFPQPTSRTPSNRLINLPLNTDSDTTTYLPHTTGCPHQPRKKCFGRRHISS